MEKLWKYEDCVELLSHHESLVRTWAYRILNNRFPLRFAPEVSTLISDPEDYLAGMAPRYLADHKAIEFAPAILDSFLERGGNVAGNCAIALGDMRYEPAADSILSALPDCKDANMLTGILYYLARIYREDIHQALQSAVSKFSDHYIVQTAAPYLLEHHDPADVPLVVKIFFQRADPAVSKHTFLGRLMASAGAASLFDNLLDYHKKADLLNSPRESILEVIQGRPLIDLNSERITEFGRLIENARYGQLAVALMDDAGEIVRARSSEWNQTGELSELLSLDRLALAFIEEFSGHLANFRQGTRRENLLKNIVAAVLACYLSIVERAGYFRAVKPDSTLEDLFMALRSAGGEEFPQSLQERLVRLSPVSELRASLTKDLSTWGDIWTVRLMGRIGDTAFIPDLVRAVQEETEGATIIHEDAIKALNGIDEAGHEELLEAVKERITGEIDILTLLQHLPYPVAFDLAVQMWKDNKLDPLELLADCLEGIGDARGIDVLREIYAESMAVDVGEALLILCLLHKREIPEQREIRHELEEDRKKYEERMKKLNTLAAKVGNKASFSSLRTAVAQEAKKKIGRNEPCPCGSGKKYKKCCMSKEAG